MDKTPAIPRFNPKGTWRTYAHAEGLAGLQTEHIAEDTEGYLWIGTWDSGACRFDGEEFRTFTTRDGLAYDWVNAVFQDREGQFWFATWGGGLSCYDPSIQRLGEKEGLPNNTVTTLIEDHQGHIWMGFAVIGGGLSSSQNSSPATTESTWRPWARRRAWTVALPCTLMREIACGPAALDRSSTRMGGFAR